MKTGKEKTRGIRALSGWLALLLLVGCAGQKPAVAPNETAPAPAAEELKAINGVRVVEDDATVSVLIDGNQLLTYTSVRQPFPAGVVLYFPDTTAEQVQPELMTESDLVGPVIISELTESGHTTRVEIGLQQDLAYEVTREGDGLRVAVAKPESAAAPAIDTATEQAESVSSQGTELAPTMTAAADAADAPPASQLVDVESQTGYDGARIEVKADGIIRNFNAFTLEDPARIVLDIYNVASPYTKEQILSVANDWVGQVRHFGNEERLRIVLDTQVEYLDQYSAEPVADGLLITVGPAAVGGDQSAGAGNSSEMESESEPEPAQAAEVQAAAPATAGVPAWVNRIDFSGEDDGRSTLTIGTTAPVQYQIDETGDQKLLLTLINAQLPEYRRKPLITTRFESAVDRVVPYQTEDQPLHALFSFDLRQMVSYEVEQVHDLVMVHFEASTVAARPLDEAELPPWQQAIHEAMAAPPADEPAPGEVQAPVDTGPVTVKASDPMEALTGTKEFSGEKIALDFFDTDIKNVFRILREVSGKNFAIDKDVSGRVTLTLDKPVPWDQVLDLVLRMNQLGMVFEGEIIRIATMETIKKEEDQRQELFTAVQQAKEKEDALEELETEFVSVSYADITDIEAKVKLLLTEGRGTSSVHQGTNQIIITDVAKVIEKAKSLIAELDKPTPQVMIEARIVEADSSLLTSLGISWAASGKVSTSASGSPMGEGDYTFATNNLNTVWPVDAAVDTLMNLTFSRIPGDFFDVVTASLDALETTSDGKTISSPKVLTLDHTAATITQGDSVPYNTRDEAGNTTTEFKEIELKLTVTPHVTTDNRIKMQVDVKNDVVKEFTDGTGSATSNVQTELLVNDGDTVVIGGILKTTKNKSGSAIPGLSKIPIIGLLFQTNSETVSKKELLVFITPRIVQLERQEL